MKKLILLVWLSICSLVLTAPAQATSVQWLTLVSLTFDDGLTQSAARNILAKHGMQGTFYINSNLIGSGSTYLTKAELDGLYADGNEIGGHTISHVDLATLSDAAQKSAICNDLQNLLDWGYPVHSFAYPYGSTGPTTQSIMAAGCPGIGTYQSARTVGNLVSGTECQNCPRAESLPPANPYYISTNNSIASTTTLDDLKGYVIQAETTGGGWVPLVFHRVCDGCNTLSVSPAILDAFLTWLETRSTQYTYVRTVNQVMTGDYPPPPPPPQLGINLLTNPSLEIDANADNQADCWSRSKYGTNTGSFAHINDPLLAHSGNFSDQITITSYSSGDNKLLPTLDVGQTAGGCAPAVVAGEIYQISAWYKSTVQSALVLFYLDANGVWRYWLDGPQLPVSSTWTQMIYYQNGVPAGAKAISFGIALNSAGTLVTDDYSMAAVIDTTAPVDSIPPTIVAFAPADGTVVTGAVNLTASATDNVAIDHVDFIINGAVFASDKTKPYSATWNSATVANGSVAYSVRAVDIAGNPTVSDMAFLTTMNDLTSPIIAFDQPPTPLEGATVSGQQAVAATATDDIGVVKVDFLVNDVVVASDSVAPYAITWNSLLNADGAATLTAKAYDAAGNSTLTDVINLTISNHQGNLLKNPSLEIDTNNDNIADNWQRSGFGTNSFIWTRLNGAALAHSGNFAESLQITSRTSGDRKLLQPQDAGILAPAVVAGKRYTLRSFYKSTTATGFVVYYRSSAGVWTYWVTSSSFAASNAWVQASFTTPPIPAGATSLSFGLYLNNVGTLITDDYALELIP
ncbi:hypothetical protein JCM14076_23610 [Methylosoma difficile]